MRKLWGRAFAALLICLLLAGPVYADTPKNLKVLDDVISLIEERYLHEVDRDLLIAGALAGILNSLGDPYSEYFTPDEYEYFMEMVTSESAGIGVMLVDVNGQWLIEAVLEDSPAWRAGIRAGDLLIAVEGQPVADLWLEELLQLVRGEKGTWVSLQVRRGEAIVNYRLQRAAIHQPTVAHRMLDGRIGFLRIASFGEKTAEEVGKAVASLKTQGMRGLLLDLRDNPGGLMQAVIDVAGHLLPAGAVMQLEQRGSQCEVVESAGPGLGENVPIAVLTSQLTASAAEILAGALQERAGALLLGETTFGKGVMQDIYELGEHGEYGALKITTGEFMTPGGTKIQGVGIRPSVAVMPEMDQVPFLTGMKTLYPGMDDEEVGLLQSALSLAGVYDGPIDGYYSASVQAAVESVQRMRGDEWADGVADGWTQMEINDLLLMQEWMKLEGQMIEAAMAWLQGQIMFTGKQVGVIQYALGRQ